MTAPEPLFAKPLIRKLETLGPLPSAAKDALANLPHTTRRLAAREDLTMEGDRPDNIYLLVDGCVFRSTIIATGNRQIMALHIPGAILNLQNLFLAQMDHTISTLVPTTVALITRREVRQLLDAHPIIATRLWHQTFIDAAIARKWLTSVGRRSAHASVAHFICEFVARMQAAGLCDGKTCDFPMTQTELGDALGLSTVHVNRTLKKLHQERLVTWNSRSLILHDWTRLNEVADFSDVYLELRTPGARD
jgi:CRP-like cAMP-binding protein